MDKNNDRGRKNFVPTKWKWKILIAEEEEEEKRRENWDRGYVGADGLRFSQHF